MQNQKINNISVIVTTRNEELNIKKCLASVKNQSYPKNKIELIVVDNNSTDKTKIIAKKYTEKVYNLGPERSAQRNFGIAKARAGYVLYLDADMNLDKKVLSECVQKMESNKKLVGLYIPEIITGSSFFAKVRRYERSFYNATVIDCVRFVRKDMFEKTGGFDENMSGPEDWDFDKKIRSLGQVDIILNPIYHNESDFNLYTYLKKKSYYIRSFDIYIKKWGSNDPDIEKQLGFFYRFIGVFTENGKWKKILSQPFLFFGIYCLRFLLGLVYLAKLLKLNINLRK